MKILRSSLTDPDRNAAFGTTAVAITVVVMAYSTIFGQISILLFYGCWLPLLYMDYRSVGAPLRRVGIPLALCGLMLVSALWSQDPATTARGAVQYLSQIFCACVAARILNLRTFCIGIVAGCFIVILYSLVAGGYSYDIIDGGYAFSGAFSSKNQLGSFSSFGIYFCIALYMAPRRTYASTLLAFVTAATCGYTLYLAQSTTSVMTLAATVAVFFVLKAGMRLRPNFRLSIFIIGVPICAAVIIALMNSSIAEQVLNLLGKDSTLTGRTYLWSEGMKKFAESPFLGVGYAGFWVQGSSEAERLWSEFFIESRTGFHFHNTYIGVLVELGIVGCGLLVAMLSWLTLRLGRRLIANVEDYEALVMTGFVFMLIARSFFEIDITGAYSFGTFLIMFAYMFVEERAVRRPHLMMFQQRSVA